MLKVKIRSGVTAPSRKRQAVYSCIFIIVLIILHCLPDQLMGADRFPRPEFQTGYQLPEQAAPAAQPGWYEYIDTAVLLICLGLAGFLALKKRSRSGLFILMLFSLAYFGFWREGCVCPIGAIQNVTLAFTDRAYRLPLTVAAFFLLPLVVALFFGRIFCAAVCPLGAIQDVVVLRPRKIPAAVARCLGMIPYIYLALAVLYAWTGAGFIICRFDPFVGFFRMSGHPGMMLFGGCLLVLGTVIARPYCRFLCPYGVLLNWMSRFSKWHVTITPDDCIQCRLCEDSCPFGAIRPPTPETVPAAGRKDIRRLSLWICLVPVIMLLGGWLGRYSGNLLSRYDRRVRLAGQIQREDSGQTDETTVDSSIFHETGKQKQELFDEVAVLKKRYGNGGLFMGGFLGLVFGLNMCALGIRPRRDRYEPDRGECFSCGRCFSFCSRERERLKRLRTDEQQ